mgnify:CR=1 FL=1
MNLERTSLINESWKANSPTVRDLLAIEREQRNAYISGELAEMSELDYHNDYDYDYELDNA